MQEVENVDYLDEFLKSAYETATQEIKYTSESFDINFPIESKIIGIYAKELITTFRNQLISDFGDNLPTLINIAKWFYKVAVQQRNIYVKLVHEAGIAPICDYDVNLIQDYSYSEIGRTNLLGQCLLNSVEQESFISKILEFDFEFYPDDILKVNSLMWFSEVIETYKSKNKINTSILDQAYMAASKSTYYSEFCSGQNHQKKHQARMAVTAKLKNDPKQMALKEIEKEFYDSKYPFNKRGYRAKFCREMHKKFQIIEDIKTIEKVFDRLNKKPLS